MKWLGLSGLVLLVCTALSWNFIVQRGCVPWHAAALIAAVRDRLKSKTRAPPAAWPRRRGQ